MFEAEERKKKCVELCTAAKAFIFEVRSNLHQDYILLILDATVRTMKKKIKAANFFQVLAASSI